MMMMMIMIMIAIKGMFCILVKALILAWFGGFCFAMQSGEYDAQ
jgi:hypothetical protein